MKISGKLMIAVALIAFLSTTRAHDFNEAECADLSGSIEEMVTDRDSGVPQSHMQIADLSQLLARASLGRDDKRKVFEDEVDKKRYAEIRDYIYRHPRLAQWEITRHVYTSCMLEYRGASVEGSR